MISPAGIERAASPQARTQLLSAYDKAEHYCREVRQYSVAPGNFAGGLTTIEEKSMGAPVARIAEGPRRALQVGGAVKQPRLLYAPEPEYPVLAQRSHIAGVVVIEALIDEKGDVTEAHVVSGHPLLITSALKAVSKRKYVPTYLDGLAMQVSLRVILSFDFR